MFREYVDEEEEEETKTRYDNTKFVGNTFHNTAYLQEVIRGTKCKMTNVVFNRLPLPLRFKKAKQLHLE